VIVTAANSQYYMPLQAAVYEIHKNFPDFQLIIFDLGLKKEELEKVRLIVII
jgi:lipopolysaccharide biosynthesis glycosyltransferase